LNLAGIEIEQVGGHLNFNPGLGQRLAFFHRGNPGDGIHSLTQKPRRTREHAASLGGAASAP
jgi:hypothetical protein